MGELQVWLIPVGIAVGAFGTLIGAGGGFLLVPLLLFAYPGDKPETVTSISLAVVFFNAASGSIAYGRMKRIDWTAAIIFALASLPGTIIGAQVTGHLPVRVFDGLLGVLLLAIGGFLALHRGDRVRTAKRTPDVEPTPEQPNRAWALGHGAWISTLVGFVSSVLGIGGGIIHVPALVRILKFPVHVATATSHFILMVMAFSATVVHVWSGAFSHGWKRTALLSIGVIIGAQLGARWSLRVQARGIVFALAIALAFVGVRLSVLACMGETR